MIPATGLENWPIMEVGTNSLFVRGLAGVVWPSLSLSLFLPQIVARLVDGSRFHPFKEKFGTTLCAGFARISGCVGGSHNCTFPPPHTHAHTLLFPYLSLFLFPSPPHSPPSPHRHLVGLLANNGELSAAAAIKGTHFIRMCTLRGIPLVFLQNTPSDAQFLSETGNDGATVKSRAQMMATLACSTVPKITVVMGGSYGPSSYAMVCTLPSSPNTHSG